MSGRGDDDLILHYDVTRECGWAARGPSPKKVFGAVAGDVVMHQLAAELHWAAGHGSESYAVLNVCRALRYRDERVLGSKTEGGIRALAQQVQPALVQRALDDRRAGTCAPITRTAAMWVRRVAAALNR